MGIPSTRTLFISGVKSWVLKLPFFLKNDDKKWFSLSNLKLTEPLQSCCCPAQKCLPRMAELARQLSRYLWRGSVNFKINSRPLFTVIFKLKNDNFNTQDYSPLIERVLAGVTFYVPMHQCAVHCNAPVIFVGLRIAMKIQFLFWIFKLLAMEYVDSRLVIPTLLFINGTAAVKL